MFGTASDADDAALLVLKPGIAGYRVDEAGPKLIVNRGYPEYKHALGPRSGPEHPRNRPATMPEMASKIWQARREASPEGHYSQSNPRSQASSGPAIWNRTSSSHRTVTGHFQNGRKTSSGSVDPREETRTPERQEKLGECERYKVIIAAKASWSTQPKIGSIVSQAFLLSVQIA